MLANRLTTSGLYKVLLLEAGGDPNPISDIPFFVSSMFWTSMDYAYTSIPQEHACLALPNQVSLNFTTFKIMLMLNILSSHTRCKKRKRKKV